MAKTLSEIEWRSTYIMKSLYELAQKADNYTAGWMSRQPAVKEESITDWLLDFFDQNSSLIQYYQFNHHEEARYSGADWDWWFLLRKGCFKIRVQAKRVRKNHDHYPNLARSNRSGYQLDKLLDSSSKYNFYPIYSLYGFSENIEKCPKLSDRGVSYNHSLFICSAQEVYNLVFGLPRNRIESSDLLKLSIPLPCLFCCPLVSNFSNDGPFRLFQHYFPSPTRDTDDGAEHEGHRGYEDEVPSIIRALFEARRSIDATQVGDNIQEILSRYQRDFVGTNGVAIFKIE